MNRPVNLRTDAQREFIAAAEWYEQQQAGLGAAFIDEVEKTLARITLDAARDELIAPGHRRAFVKRFPFFVIYSEETDRILVLAVMHAARNPSAWQQRLDLDR